MLAHLRTFEGISQADPTCVAITWTQESFPLYPLRLLFNSESIICKLFWNDFKKYLCFSETLFFIRESFAFFQWTFYLLLSCATFSSVDNVTECVDCVSGWTFFCPQNVSSVYKCLICVLIGLFLNVSNYVQKLVPSAKHRRPSKSRLWPIDQEICIWYQHSAIHLTAVNMKC